MDCSLPGLSVHGILQARILEWVAIPSPVDLPDPGIEPVSLRSPTLGGRVFIISATWKARIIYKLNHMKLLVFDKNYSLCGLSIIF